MAPFVSDVVSSAAEGAIPSPNIWRHPHLYELENAAVDPDRVIEETMLSVRPWAGATVLDIGCGSGFHLRRFAADADRVIGVEPHRALASAARRRVAGLAHVDVREGSAQRLPIDAASIDVAHARWAYFFGPGCEPGLRELDRVMRRGGAAFVIDNDASRSTFGGWFRRALPDYDQESTDSFFARNGWEVAERQICWQFENRADFEAVVRIEFAPKLATEIIAEHSGTYVDYAVKVRLRRF